jgi:hypothetical protein
MWLDWISDEFQTIPKDDFEQIFNFKEMYSKSISDFYYIKISKISDYSFNRNRNKEIGRKIQFFLCKCKTNF